MGKIENGVYYNSKGEASHRGIVKIGDRLYYAGKNGVIVKDSRKTIRYGMANGMVHHGSYYFDADGVCDLDSFKKVKHKHSAKVQRIGKWTVKKTEKIIIVTLCAITFGIFVIADVRVLLDDDTDKVQTEAETVETVAEENRQIEMTLPAFEEEVYLCSDTMKRYYQGELTLQEVVESGAVAYQPFVFEYTIKNAETASLLLSENADYSDGTAYALDVHTGSISVDNLKTDTVYYYLVTAEAADGTETSGSGEFQTADTNRFLSFDGVYNTRDIGGYDTVYGKKVKQGVLVRGTELDGLVESSYYLRDTAVTDPFGFVCDFDLRSATIFNTKYASRLGATVEHKFYNSPMYGGIFAVGTETLLKEIFTDLADKNNYPMYLHCTYGADRTGTIIYLLQGLLGVSEEDMKTEYELTGFFSKSYVYGDGINVVYSGVQGCDGDTINEKIESYMIDTVGLTKEQIQSIRDIFLG